jgi:hypothetical protein
MQKNRDQLRQFAAEEVIIATLRVRSEIRIKELYEAWPEISQSTFRAAIDSLTYDAPFPIWQDGSRIGRMDVIPIMVITTRRRRPCYFQLELWTEEKHGL